VCVCGDLQDIITDAREIVRINGFADKITLIQGKVEEIQLPVTHAHTHTYTHTHGRSLRPLNSECMRANGSVK